MGERQPKVTEKVPDGRRAVLWLFAFVFVGLSLKRAWYWPQQLWWELNNAAPTWSGQARMAVTEVGPLIGAICAMVLLWKTVGPPFSLPRGTSPASTRGEPAVKHLPPQWKNFESRAEVERRAEQTGEALRFWRKLSWLVMSLLLCASSAWALLCVTCAIDGPGYLFDGYRASELWALGLKPLILVVVLALLLWGVIGPPFARHRRQ